MSATNALWTGHLQDAEAQIKTAISLLSQDVQWFCRAAITCATVYYSIGRRDAASKLAHEALLRVETANVPDAHVGLLQLLGVTHLLSLDFERALEILFEALELAKANGLITERVFIEYALARYLVRKGDFEAALGWSRSSDAGITKYRLPVLRAYFAEVKGEMLLGLGQVYEALDALEEGLESAAALGDRRAACQILAVMGRAWSAADLPERAFQRCGWARRLLTKCLIRFGKGVFGHP